MPDNLSISISADTTKLRADLALVQARVRELGSQLRQASVEANRTGDTTKVLQFAQQLDVATKSAAALQRQIRATYQTIAEPTAWREAAKGVAEVAGAFGGLGRVIGEIPQFLGKGGTIGLGIAAAVIGFKELVGTAREMAESVKESARYVGDLTDRAKTLNLPFRQLQAVELAASKKGLEDVNGLLARGAKLLGDWQLEQAKATGNLPGLPTVMRGGAGLPGGTAGQTQLFRGGIADQYGNIALRGGQQPPMSNIFEQLHLDPRTYFDQKGGLDLLKFYQDAARELSKWGDSAAKASIAAEIFGKQWQRGLILFQDFPKALEEANKNLDAMGGGISQNTQKNAEEVQAAMAVMEKSIKDFSTSIQLNMPGVVTSIEKVTAGVQELRDLPKNVGAYGEQLKNELTGAFEEIGANAAKSATIVEGNFVQAFTDIQNAATPWYQNMMKMLTDIGSAMGKITPGTPAMPFATGGVVPGYGSGDTVPARLTPGEFVNRKSSVNYYGPDVFQALNRQLVPREIFTARGYAAGGLVDVDPGILGEQLSSGGMFRSSGASKFTIVIGGEKHIVFGDEWTANNIRRHALAEALRSGGRKPSWAT